MNNYLRQSPSVLLVFVVSLTCLSPPTHAAECNWNSGFHVPGLDRYARAFAVFDDGHGPALYVGGRFRTADDRPAALVAKWNGTEWTGLLFDAGPYNEVGAMTVFDDGTGPELYVGGAFSIVVGQQRIDTLAKWDGKSWSRVGNNLFAFTGPVLALASLDDGKGPALYVGGDFSQGGGVQGNVIKWDGSSWSGLGGGLPGRVLALEAYDSGTGPALYAGGSFSGGVAKWDGATWSPVGCCVGSGFEVRALAVGNLGAGNRLYAGGTFNNIGGISTKNIAAYDGAAWSALGSGVLGTVRSLKAFMDGGIPALFVGGDVRLGETGGILKWKNSTWSGVGALPNNGVWSLTTFDDGDGMALYAGGFFSSFGLGVTNHIARWNGSVWSPLSRDGSGDGISGGSYGGGSISTLTKADLGSGEKLYVGGHFSSAGTTTAEGVARWDSPGWTALKMTIGFNSTVLATFGQRLYSGLWDTIFPCVSRWTGEFWEPFASCDENAFLGVLDMLAVETGPLQGLYAVGGFTALDNVSANGIAKWDGFSWTPLGGGLSGTARALAVADFGNGAELYVGGSFTSAGDQSAHNLAKWNGATWSAVGTGTNGEVNNLAVGSFGSRPALFIGGSFTTSGGANIPKLAKWDGTVFSSLGDTAGLEVSALTLFDDGYGAALYVADSHLQEDRYYLRRFDLLGWSMVAELDGSIESFEVMGQGEESSLFVGGDFAKIGEVVSVGIGRYSCTQRPLFIDGFESGNTIAWSQTVP